MARSAHPGMSQDEKDQIGAEQHKERQHQALLDRLADQVGVWTVDERLDADDLDLDQLREEATRRALDPLPKSLGRDELVKRLRARRREVERHLENRGKERPYRPLKPWEPSP